MNCRDIEDLLLSGLDEPLSAADQALVDAHLPTCPTCVESLRAHVTTIELVRELGRSEDAAIAPPLSEDLVQRILAARVAATTGSSARRTG
jgi:anti-sigma factor RsiW